MFAKRGSRFASANMRGACGGGHRYSDSQSSLASLATSRSGAHSRISSVTTINEIPSIDSVLTEESSTDWPNLVSSPTLLSMMERREGMSGYGNKHGAFTDLPKILSSTRAAGPSDAVPGMEEEDRPAPHSATIAE